MSKSSASFLCKVALSTLGLLFAGNTFAGDLNIATLPEAVPDAADRELLITACVADPNCKLVYNSGGTRTYPHYEKPKPDDFITDSSLVELKEFQKSTATINTRKPR